MERYEMTLTNQMCQIHFPCDIEGVEMMILFKNLLKRTNDFSDHLSN